MKLGVKSELDFSILCLRSGAVKIKCPVLKCLLSSKKEVQHTFLTYIYLKRIYVFLKHTSMKENRMTNSRLQFRSFASRDGLSLGVALFICKYKPIYHTRLNIWMKILSISHLQSSKFHVMQSHQGCFWRLQATWEKLKKM